MIYFIAFIYGVALFYSYKFFPFISLFVSLILLVILIFSAYLSSHKFPLCKASGGMPSLRPALHALFSLSLTVIIAFTGFYYAKTVYIPLVHPSEVAGETIKVIGVSKAEAIVLNPDRGVFVHTVEVKRAKDKDNKILNLKELRVVANKALSTDKTYFIEARIARDSYFLNPGGNRNRISGYAVEIRKIGAANNNFFEKARLRLNSFIKNNFSPESGSFLTSIITGERSLLTKETKDAFRATGLAHILSISGAHFGLLLFILFVVFKALIRLLPQSLLVRLTLYLTPSQIAAILCIPFMVGYLGISSMQIPALRAFIMIAIFLLSLLIQRKGFLLNALLFAAVAIVFVMPDSITSLSFQLSFIAVLCIGIVVEQERWATKDHELKDLEMQKPYSLSLQSFITSAIKYMRISALISLAATAGTAPLIIYYFHYLSLISPITNVVVVPVIGFVILPLSLISSFVYLIFGGFPLVSLIDGITGFVLSTIKYIASWRFVDIKIQSFPLILLIMFYIGIAVYIVTNYIDSNSKGGQKINSQRQKIARVAIPIAIAVIPIILYLCIMLFNKKGLYITYLDVGQGNAAVIELPDNRTLVLDTGRRGFQVGTFLRYRGIESIDALILSHESSDHIGGVGYLMRNFNIHEIWDNGRLIYPDGFFENVIHRPLQRGDIIKGNGYTITALHPYKGFYTRLSGREKNNDSLVLHIKGYRNSFLFAGDIEREAEEDLSHLKEHIKSTVLKVPHHGSRTSTSEVFLNTVSPEIAIISVGRRNMFGHPHKETLNTLRDVKIFRTDIDGAVSINALPSGNISIKRWAEHQFTEAKTAKDEIANLKRLFIVW